MQQKQSQVATADEDSKVAMPRDRNSSMLTKALEQISHILQDSKWNRCKSSESLSGHSYDEFYIEDALKHSVMLLRTCKYCGKVRKILADMYTPDITVTDSN